MKIPSNITIKQNFIKKTESGNENQLTRTQNILNQSKSICNPKFYQAYNQISFGKSKEPKLQHPYFILSDGDGNPSEILSKITLNSGEKHNLHIGKDLIDRFMMSKDGEIDYEVLQKFISTYKTILQDITNKDDATNAFLTAISKGESPSPKKSNISYINPNDEAMTSILSALSNPEEEFVYSFFNGIKNEQTRKMYADSLLRESNKMQGVKYDEALRQTTQLFEICKTQDGYDFSDIERKIRFTKKLEKIQSNFSSTHNQAITADIIKYSKSQNGHFNMDFAEALCQLINNTGSFLPDKLVSHRHSILQVFSALDNRHSKEILDSIVKLSSIIEIDDSNDDFEQILFNMFNPVTNKFDEKSANLLLELAPLIIKYTDDLPIETIEDYDNYRQIILNLINRYFEHARDSQTGCIKPDVISPEEYANLI